MHEGTTHAFNTNVFVYAEGWPWLRRELCRTAKIDHRLHTPLMAMDWLVF